MPVGVLESTVADGVLRLVVSSEATANAMTARMTEELAKQLLRADADPEISVVVITGAGRRAFCSGHDIGELVRDPTSAYDAKVNDVFLLPRQISKPTVAAVNGAAYAGGFNLALACDVRIASTRASFGATGARLAMLPLAGQLSALPSLAGPGVALDMLLRARPVDAARAYEVGLVSQVVEADELDDAVKEAAAFIASTPAALNAAIKRAVWAGVEETGRRARSVEVEEAAGFGRSPEAATRLTAFLERSGVTR